MDGREYKKGIKEKGGNKNIRLLFWVSNIKLLYDLTDQFISSSLIPQKRDLTFLLWPLCRGPPDVYMLPLIQPYLIFFLYKPVNPLSPNAWIWAELANAWPGHKNKALYSVGVLQPLSDHDEER